LRDFAELNFQARKTEEKFISSLISSKLRKNLNSRPSCLMLKTQTFQTNLMHHLSCILPMFYLCIAE